MQMMNSLETSSVLDKYWQNDGADIYYGNCVWVDVDRKIEYIKKPQVTTLEELLYRMVLIHSSTFIRKSAYEKAGVYDVTYRYCMDKELLYRMFRMGMKFEYIDECLTKFKSGGISNRNAVAVFKEGSRMALGYGEPKVKVLWIEYKKRSWNVLVNLMKNTYLFRVLKKAKRSDE